MTVSLYPTFSYFDSNDQLCSIVMAETELFGVSEI